MAPVSKPSAIFFIRSDILKSFFGKIIEELTRQTCYDLHTIQNHMIQEY